MYPHCNYCLETQEQLWSALSLLQSPTGLVSVVVPVALLPAIARSPFLLASLMKTLQILEGLGSPSSPDRKTHIRTQEHSKFVFQDDANNLRKQERWQSLTFSKTSVLTITSFSVQSRKVRRSETPKTAVSPTSLRALECDRNFSHVRMAKNVIPNPRTTPSPAIAILANTIHSS